MCPTFVFLSFSESYLRSTQSSNFIPPGWKNMSNWYTMFFLPFVFFFLSFFLFFFFYYDRWSVTKAERSGLVHFIILRLLFDFFRDVLHYLDTLYAHIWERMCVCVYAHMEESSVEPIFINQSQSVHFILPLLGPSQTLFWESKI